MKKIYFLIALFFAQYYVKAQAGAALNFDGFNDFVQLPAASSLDNLNAGFTLEAWINISNGTSVASSVIRKTGDYNMYIYGGKLYAEVWPTAGDPTFIKYSGNTTINAGTWTHCAISWNGSSCYLYVNGVLQTVVASVSSAGGNENLWLGYSFTYGEPFQGSMDEVRVWNRALCQQEIQSSMNCEIPGAATNLVLNYHFNQGVAGSSNGSVFTLTDASGNGTNGILSSNFAFTGTTSNWVAPGGVTSGTSCGSLSACLPTTGMNFDGTNDYVTIPDDPNLNFGATGDFTIETYFNSSVSLPNFTGLVVKASNAQVTGYQLVVVTNRIAAEFGDASGAMLGTGNGLIGSTTITDGNWHQLAMIVNRSANNIQLVVDGNVEASVTNAAVSGYNVNNSFPMYLGTERTRGIFLNGNLDEVRIWNRALCIPELNSHRNEELTGTQTGLVAYYKMNDGVGGLDNTAITSVADATGNGHTGAPANMLLNGGTSNWVTPGAVITGTSAPAFVTPVVTVASSSTVPYCAGGSTVISASGSSYYSWTPATALSSTTVASPTASPLTTTTYSVTSGCVGGNTATVTVNVNPRPTPVISGSTLLCPGGSLILSATDAAATIAPYTYSWSNGSMASTSNPVTTAGAYAVTITNANGCSGAAVVTVTSAIVNVTSTTGTNACYNTLKEAFDAINAGTHTGVVSIQIAGNTTETASCVLNASGTGSASYTSISIQPLGGAARTITGSVANALIDLSGADNVTIDGLNTGGNSLTIVNSNSGAAANAIRFINDASNNTVTNCTIKGATTGASTSGVVGVVVIGTGSVTGNDNNTISYCSIGPNGSSLPAKAITSGSTTGMENDGLLIDHNSIFDYHALTGAIGIDLGTGTNGAIISNNQLYQSASRSISTTGSGIYAISINNASGGGFQVLNNTIGYATALGSGNSTYSFGTTTNKTVTAISILAGSAVASSIQGNTITAYSLTGAATGTGVNGPFKGIFIQGGNVNVGDVTGNIIGNMSATGITYSSTAAALNEIYGIYMTGLGTCVMKNNQVGGISISATTGARSLYGIRCAGSYTWTCSNNTIGGPSAASLSNNSTNASATTGGITSSSTGGVPVTISDNTVRNISTSGGTGSNAAVSLSGIGLFAGTGANTVSHNTVYGLTNASASAQVCAIDVGINAVVERNQVYKVGATASSGVNTGILVYAGNVTIRNNMISLGKGTSVNGTVKGISVLTGTSINLWHNTVFIGGVLGAGNSGSIAYAGNSTTTRSVRDNIFVNTRYNTGSSSGKHYVISESNNMNLAINNNLYYCTPSNTFGVYGGTDVASLANWATTVGQDANSNVAYPVFVDTTNVPADLHILSTSPADGTGANVGVTNDFDGETRSSLTPTDIGADAIAAPCTTPAASISGSADICAGSNATVTFSGTNNATVYYHVNSGGVQSILLNASGTNTITHAIAVDSTYTVDSVKISTCSAAITGQAAAIHIATVSGTTVVTNVACFGSNTGAINLTPTGGTGPYTFNWLPSGPTTEDRTGLVAGTYSVQITDANACTGTVTASVTQPASALSITAQSSSNIPVYGGSTGAASVNAATGGTAGYTYDWTPGTPTGDGTTSVSALTAGIYTCTVTDANGCTATQSFTITQTGAALRFDGTNDKIAVSSNAALNLGAGAFTLEAWVNPSNLTGSAAYSIIRKPGSYNLFLIFGQLWAEIWPAGTGNPTWTQVRGSTAFALNTWTHVALVWNGTTGVLYQNGVVDPSSTVGGSISVSANLFIGSNEVSSEFFAGTMDEVRIWSRALCQSEIQNNKNCEIATTGTGLVVNYHFNQGNADAANAGVTTLTDVSGNGINGTLTNFALTGSASNWTGPGGVTSGVSCSAFSSPVTVSLSSSTNVSCNGGSNGAASVTASGGSGLTYNWTPGNPTGDGTASVTGLSAQVYTCTVTNSCGGVGTATVNITAPSAVSGTTVVTNVACFGGNTGAINLTPTGGTGPYTFNWLPSGPTTEDRTSLVAGTYSVQITDANGCTGTVTATVNQPTAPVSGTTVVTNVACFGGNTGAINLTPTGGTGPYTFNWLPSGPTTEDRTNLVAGTYSVQITDANGCTGTVTATVTQPISPVSGTTVVTNVACFGGNTGAINLTPTGGIGPYTFNWLPSGPTTEDRTSLVAGTYSVQITDANGCVGTVTATVNQPTAPVSGTTVVTNVACFGGNTGAINLTPTGGTGPYTFNWLPSGPTTEDRTGLIAGTYSVQITDANGCTGTVTTTVNQPTAPVSGTTVVTNVSCFSGSNGTINLTPTGGTSPYTFNWLPSGPTTEDRTGLVAGTYSVQITDANGCTTTVTASISQPASAVSGTTVVTNVSCFGGSTGAINLTPTGGTAPYTFNWLPSGSTTEDRTGLAAGTYSVQITDANGCSGTVTTTITQPIDAVSATTIVTDVSCHNGNNGQIQLSTNGGNFPYTYLWNDGYTSGDYNNVPAGTYTVTVTDQDGCTATATATVNEPSTSTSYTTSVTNVSCSGGSNGAIDLSASGGTAPYTYSWSNGATTEDLTGLAAGTYSVLVTDANNCTSLTMATVSQPFMFLQPMPNVTNVSCFGGVNGQISLGVFGGTAPYTFAWTDGPVTQNRTNLTAGNYTVTITDANGCTAVTTPVVSEPAAVTSTLNETACDAYTLNGTTYTTSGTYTQVLANASATGCDSTITLNLTILNATASTLNAVSCGDYTLNGTVYNVSGTYTQVIPNAAGCDSTITLNLLVNQPTASALNAVSCGDYTLNGTTYSVSGTYAQTIPNAAGCDSTITLNLTVNQPTASTLSAVSCGDYTLNGTVYSVSGTYTQTLTNAAGCDSTITLNLTVNQPTASTLSAVSCGDYTLNGTVYSVSGTYTQTLTNAPGCDSTITLNLTVNQPSFSSLTEVACSSYTLNGTTYNASGTYTQVIPNTAGCDSTITLNLTVNQPSSSTLNEVACGSYTLNGTTYNASGTYTQVIPNAAGCDSTITLVLTVNTVDASVTQNDNVLTANAAGLTYQWIDCDNGSSIIAGETNQTFTAQANGNYAVIVSDGVCSDTSGCSAVNTIGIKDVKAAEAAIFIMPNPNNGNFTIKAPEGTYYLVNELGQQVMKFELNIRDNYSVNVKELSAGVYYLIGKDTTNRSKIVVTE